MEMLGELDGQAFECERRRGDDRCDIGAGSNGTWPAHGKPPGGALSDDFDLGDLQQAEPSGLENSGNRSADHVVAEFVPTRVASGKKSGQPTSAVRLHSNFDHPTSLGFRRGG
jgi:hypothetical protein